VKLAFTPTRRSGAESSTSRRHVRRGRRIPRSTDRRRRVAEGDLFGRAGAHEGARRAIHPGWANGELVNAVKLAAEVIDRLPKDRLSPETTDDREGFVHPIVISGDSSEVESPLHRPRLRGRPARPARGAPAQHRGRRRSDRPSAARSRWSRRFSTGTCATPLRNHPAIVSNLEEAVRRVGLEPKQTSIRGGTDRLRAHGDGAADAEHLHRGATTRTASGSGICVEDMGLAAATVVEPQQSLGRIAPERVCSPMTPGYAVEMSSCSTRSAGRWRPCACRSRTAATSAASMHAEGGLRPRLRVPRPQELLRFEEIERVVRVFAQLGVRTVAASRAASLSSAATSSTSSSCSPRFPTWSSRSPRTAPCSLRRRPRSRQRGSTASPSASTRWTTTRSRR